MPMTTNERLQETLSMALEDRASGYTDLVSNSNVVFHQLKERGGWKSFSGPKIRERLVYNESGTYTRYAGYQYLNPRPAELVNDAEFEPKMAAVSVQLSGEEILKNSGENQLLDLLETHMEAAENELIDRFTEDLHSAGTAENQIGGFQLMLPTTPTTGTYGGIDRATSAIWRPSTYDAHSFYSPYTQVNAISIKPMLDRMVIARSKGRKGPNLFLMCSEHWEAFSAATQAIQRINDETALGKLGFQALKYYGGGKSIDVVCEGGIGSAMPSNTSYGLDTTSIKFRYHPDRNFSKIGGKQTPINQDAVVQHLGFMGELTMNNPQHNFKFYDSTPGS